MNTDVLTIQQAAAEWGSHPWTVWRACRLGFIPGAYRVGATPNSGNYRIPREAWEKFKRSRLVEPLAAREQREQLANILTIDRVLARGKR